MPNAVEFAAALDPLVADSGYLASTTWTAEGAGIVFREARQHPGVSVSVQWSPDLPAWFASGEGPTPRTIEITTLDDDPSNPWLLRSATTPADGERFLFFRLRAVAQ